MAQPTAKLVACILACVLFLAGCSPGSVRRPIVRSAASMSAIQEFWSAPVVAKRVDVPRAEWNAAVTFGTPATSARVIGGTSMIRVAYGDSPEVQLVSEPRDYTNNLEIRARGSTLYVYRAISLIWTEYRLAVFDLATRRRVADYLVSPEDMPSAQR